MTSLSLRLLRQGFFRFTYHSISDVPSDDPLVASLAEFQDHLIFLREHLSLRYEIHFDDGYENNLQALRLCTPADRPSLFVCVDHVGTDFRFPWMPTEKLMSWQQIRELPPWITIGGHMPAHQNVALASNLFVLAKQERQQIAQFTNRPLAAIDSFAIPFGDPSAYTTESIRILNLAGYQKIYANHQRAPSGVLDRVNIGGSRAHFFARFMKQGRPLFWWLDRK